MLVVGHLPFAGPVHASAAILRSWIMDDPGRPMASLPYTDCGHAPVLYNLLALLLTLLKALILLTLLLAGMNRTARTLLMRCSPSAMAQL